jgi:hypothetical protein
MSSDEVLFSESAAAAKSLRSWWTRMAATYQCIDVQLTRSHLAVTPRRLVGWVIDLLGFDLRHRVPVERIVAVRDEGEWLGHRKVSLTFERHGGRGELLLYLRRGGELIAALGEMA